MTNVSMLLGRVETMRVLGVLEDLFIAVFKSLEKHDGRKGSSDISWYIWSIMKEISAPVPWRAHWDGCRFPFLCRKMSNEPGHGFRLRFWIDFHLNAPEGCATVRWWWIDEKCSNRLHWVNLKWTGGGKGRKTISKQLRAKINMNFQDLCCGGACKGLCQKGFILQKGQGSQRGLKVS